MNRPSFIHYVGFIVVIGLVGGVLAIGAGATRIIGLTVCFPLVYGAGYFLFKGWKEDHVPKEQREAREEWLSSRLPRDQSNGWKRS